MDIAHESAPAVATLKSVSKRYGAGLAGLERRSIEKLSGGQKRRRGVSGTLRALLGPSLRCRPDIPDNCPSPPA